MEVIRGEIATCSPQKALRSLAVNWSGLVRLDASILRATSVGRSSNGDLAPSHVSRSVFGSCKSSAMSALGILSKWSSACQALKGFWQE
jgi:hypothetical protein